MAGFVRRLPALLVALAMFLCCTVILMADGGIGLADNGDFRRVLAGNGLEVADKIDANYLYKRYYTMQLSGDTLWEQGVSLVRSYDNDTAYKSPHFLFVKASKVTNFVANVLVGRERDRYDVQHLGVLYALCLALAGYLIMRFLTGKSPWLQAFAALLLLVIFCDTGYIAYFQSFYGEALQYVALMLTVGAGLTLWRKPQSLAAVGLYLFSIYLFAGAKLANVPIAVLFLAVGTMLFFREKRPARRAICGVLAVGCLAGMILMMTDIPDWMSRDTNYQAVFYGVLRGSETPGKDLEELGIDSKYAVMANTNAYLANYPYDIHGEEFSADFHEQISKVRLALFYVKHPARLIEKCDIALKNSGAIRPVYLGNLPDARMTLTDRWSGWSMARQWLYTHDNARSMWVVLLIWGGALAFWAVCVLWRRKKADGGIKGCGCCMAAIGVLALLAGTATSWVLPFMSNGEADLAKHMFLFVHLTDLLMVASLIGVAMHISRANMKYYAMTAIAIVVCIGITSVIGWCNGAEVVSFGEWNGRELKWEQAGYTPDGATLLICTEAVDVRAFDTSNQYGENRWATADLREWLNGEFLDAFSDEERTMMVSAKTKAYLSNPFAYDAEEGTHAVYWSAMPTDQDGQDAYVEQTEDLVSLPTISQYNKGGWSRGGRYWLSDPYGGNDTMVRCAWDGYAVFADGSTEWAVRPMIAVMRGEGK
ncbi:MAG: hypothetical protein E7409_06350 [Ruminococcaceae bacterium]|nr:hypothetical protein [Oscillospiraceae bacterium]